MREFCRCLQGAAPICEEQHGRKHKGACVTTLATGWRSWHHSQQHGAWHWYHEGYLRGWSNCDFWMTGRTSNMHHLCHISLQPYFHSHCCHWLFIEMLPCVVNLSFLSKCHLLAPAFLGYEMRNFTADINNLFQGFPNFFTQPCLSVTIYFVPSESIFACGSGIWISKSLSINLNWK